MSPTFFREPRGPFSAAIIAAAARHAAEAAPLESCGLVRAGAYHRCENVAARPEAGFEIAPRTLSRAYLAGDLEGVIHSHPGGPWWPSAADMAAQIETGVPWAIIIPGEPVAPGEPARGELACGELACAWGDALRRPKLFDGDRHAQRGFLHGVSDCYSLIRDYFAERGEKLPEFPREWEWWKAPDLWGDLYLDGLERAGFEIVATDPAVAARQARPGDVFLRRVASKTPNHGGIYLGDGLLLEHPPFQLSRMRPIAPVIPVISHWISKSPMIRELHLHGALGEQLGRVHRFHAETPAEAIRALCLMVKGARRRLETGAYQVVRVGARLGAGVRSAGELRLRLAPDERELHLIPRAAGAKEGGFAKILVGTLLVAASFFVPGSGVFGANIVTGSMVGGLGVSMALGGVSSLLAPRQNSRSRGGREREESSTLFSDSQNVAAPGAAIPVVFGECEVGSVVVSAAMHAEDRA